MTRNFTTLNSYFVLVPGGLAASIKGALRIKRIRCNSATAADRWLQLHSGTAIPSNGAVPLYAPLLVPNVYISEDTFDDPRIVPAPGIVAVISSTRATLTVDAAANIDITVEVEEYELQSPVSLTTAGDLTTSIKNLEVWAESAGPKTLVRADIYNSSGGTVYVQLFAKDSPAEGAVPIRSWSLATVTPLILDFGPNAGISPYAQDADATARKGCTLLFSSTQNTKTLVGANSGTIKAYYK